MSKFFLVDYFCYRRVVFSFLFIVFLVIVGESFLFLKVGYYSVCYGRLYGNIKNKRNKLVRYKMDILIKIVFNICL